MDATRLAGRVAIVTGAASGIGRAVALRMVAEGATVVATDVNAGRLEETSALASGKGKLSTVLTDLTAPEGVAAIVAEAEAHGGPDILVNNAGIMDWFLPVGEVDDETWARVLDVNLTAPMRLMRSVVPAMAQRGKGAVVNVSSVAGVSGGAAGAAYTSSKHALVGLTRNTAVLYGPQGVRANAVCPGGVETHIAERGAVPRAEWVFERLQPAFARGQRMAQPEEIASLVAWLASDEAANVNGAVVATDGGWTAA